MVDQMKMPRFLQPFRRRGRGVHPDYVEDPVANYSDTREYDRLNMSRSGSRWRNLLPKHSQPRDVVYVDGEGEDYMIPPSDVGHAHITRRPSSHRARVIDGYSDSSISDSGSLPVRYHRSNDGRPQRSFHDDSATHTHRTPSFQHLESVPPSLDQVNTPGVLPYVASPSEVYRESPATPQIHENVSQYTQDPPIIPGSPSRFRARRSQPITIGGVRIEVENDSRHGYRGHRSHRSRSRSTGTYTSESSQSYRPSSSFEEPPIIISADPHTEIEIGNERDGFVPYEQYLADQEARRRARRRRNRRTSEGEIFVVPAGANVIFVDDDGRELHRVGEFDDHYSGRRRNSNARTTHQSDGSYVIEL